MLKQIKGSGLLCGSNGQRQLSLIKVVGVQIIYALSSKADLSTHWLDYARPPPHSPLPHIPFSSHFALFLPPHHTWWCWRDKRGGGGNLRALSCMQSSWAAEQLSSSLPAGYATRCSSSPEDFPICRRKCRFHLRRRWRRNSCERRLRILRVARSISLQRIYGHSSSRGQRGQVHELPLQHCNWSRAGQTGQVSKVFTQHKDRLGRGRGRFGSQRCRLSHLLIAFR